jgi:hypothetical protein
MTLTATEKNDVLQSVYKISVSGVIRHRAQTIFALTPQQITDAIS